MDGDQLTNMIPTLDGEENLDESDEYNKLHNRTSGLLNSYQTQNLKIRKTTAGDTHQSFKRDYDNQ